MTAILGLNEYNKNLFEIEKERKILKTNQVTNCILSTPQRLNYSLVDGTFTLKAGSKVFIDGAEYTLTQDSVSNLGSNSTDDLYIIYRKSDNNLIVIPVSTSSSGTALPDSGINFQGFYHTFEKKMYRYINGDWSLNGDLSLPIAKIRLASSEKVQTVYNYYDWYSVCGNTLIIFPGTKLLMPNGLNSDGTKKNLEITTKYSHITITLDNIRRYAYIATDGKVYALGSGRFSNQSLNNIKNINDSVFKWYIPELNVCYSRSTNGAEWEVIYRPFCIILAVQDNGSIIEETSPLTTLSVANRDEIVDLYNTQDIYGQKTFLEAILLKNNTINTWNGIHCTNSNFDLSTYTSAQQVTGCRLMSLDKNKEYFSAFQGYKAANNSQIKSQIIARTFINGDKTKPITASIEVGVNKEGTRYTYCPSSDANNSILTTVQIVETDSGVGMKLGNGLIIQWGPKTASGTTITLPIPMASDNYSILLGTYIAGSGSGNQSGGWKNKTTTSFFLQHGACDGLDWFVIGR